MIVTPKKLDAHASVDSPTFVHTQGALGGLGELQNIYISGKEKWWERIWLKHIKLMYELLEQEKN